MLSASRLRWSHTRTTLAIDSMAPLPPPEASSQGPFPEKTLGVTEDSGAGGGMGGTYRHRAGPSAASDAHQRPRQVVHLLELGPANRRQVRGHSYTQVCRLTTASCVEFSAAACPRCLRPDRDTWPWSVAPARINVRPQGLHQNATWYGPGDTLGTRKANRWRTYGGCVRRRYPSSQYGQPGGCHDRGVQ
jgi:hypothetical protein